MRCIEEGSIVILEDAFLKKVYISLAIIWSILAISISIIAGFKAESFIISLKYFLFFLYPFYAFGILYLSFLDRYKDAERNVGKYSSNVFSSIFSSYFQGILMQVVFLFLTVFYAGICILIVEVAEKWWG